jgi:hypothetical protein
MNRQYNYKNMKEFSISEDYVNKNSNQKKTSNHNNFKDTYGVNDNQPSTVIYQKQDRVCPKKGNNFFFLGVS